MELLPELPAESFDLAMTDTPFLVSLGRNPAKGRKPISEHAEAKWIEPVFKDIWRVLVPDSFCLSFYGWPHAPFFFHAWKEIGFRPMSITVGVKHNWRYS